MRKEGSFLTIPRFGFFRPGFFEFECARVQLIIFAIFRDELIVISLFDHVSVIEYGYHVGILYGGKPMRDHEYRSALHQSVRSLLNDQFRSRIDGRGRLVHNHDGGVADRRSRNGEKLPLPLRKIGAVARQHGLISLRKSRDETVRVCKFRRGVNFLVRRVEFPVADVLHDRPREEVGILQNDAERTPQV